MYLLNAFSLNMLAMQPANIATKELTLTQACELLDAGFISSIGHEDMAYVISEILDLDVPFNRSTIVLRPGDKAIVAQYIGARLPEGATRLPTGAAIKWILVEVA